MRFISFLAILPLLATSNCGRRGQTHTQECLTHEDCTNEAMPFCHTGEGRCVGCLSDASCACHETCSEDQCLPIGAADATGAANAHGNWIGIPGQDNYTFVSLCDDSDDCRVGDICNPFTRGCMSPPDDDVSCQNDVNACPAGLECDPQTELCLPPAACFSNFNCCGMEEFRCSSSDPTVAGVCFRRECLPPDPITATCPMEPKIGVGCPNGTFCSPVGICVQCVCDDECNTSSKPECDVVGGVCVPAGFCREPSDCVPTQSCDRIDHRCAPHCADDGGCVKGDYCDPADNVCRCDPDAFEANESRTSARWLPVPERNAEPVLLELTLCEDDIDWYSLTLERGDHIQITAHTESDLQGNLTLYGADGIANLATGTVSQFPQALELNINTDDTYYLHVSRIFSFGDYSLEIVRSTGVVCDEGGQNNSANTATVINDPAVPVALGCIRTSGELTGYHAIECVDSMRLCPLDIDYYIIHVPAGSEAVATVGNYPDQNIDLVLYGPFEPSQAATETVYFDSSVTSGDEETVYGGTRVPAKFLLRVSESFGYDTPYDLHVEVRPIGGTVCIEDIYDTQTESPEPFDTTGYNDRFADASGIALEPSIPRDLDLTMCVTDLDWFVLGANTGGVLDGLGAGQRVSAEILNVSTQPTDLLVFIGTNPQSVANALQSGNPQTQSVQLPTNGELVYVAVAAKSSVEEPVNYTLRFELEPPPACNLDTLGDLSADSRNDTPAAAAPLLFPPWPSSAEDPAHTYPAGDTEELSSCVGDADWYTIEMGEYTGVNVDITYTIGTGELGLAVYDSTVASATLPEADIPTTGQLDLSTNNNTGAQSVRAEAGEDTVYIVVYNRGDWPVSAYDLTVEITPAGCIDDALEDNDTAATATPVILHLSPTTAGREEAKLTGLLVCETDVDWYSVPLQQLDLLEVTVNYDPSQGNTNLFLFRPDGGGSSLASDYDNSNTGVMSFSYRLPSTSAQGDYLIKLDPGTSPDHENEYDMEFVIHRDCLDDRFGPATYRWPTALTLPDDNLEYGSMQLCDNEDWFAVSTQTSTSVSVCSRFDHYAADIDVQVFDTYPELGTTTPIADSRTKNNFEELTLNAVAGTTYYVRLYLDFRSPGDITYGLWIVDRPGGCPDMCADHVVNGDETDVDCGGAECAKCAIGYACDEASDCASNNCSGGICQ